ncbi:MAG: hypothetical protein NTU49_04995 [Gammaproteobacteria bacterium]|nr:hypothetical protein [Gammaproteobacteria bacterium]
MRRDHYALRATEVSKTEFENASYRRSNASEKTHALQITCEMNNDISGSAYFIVSTGEFLTDSTNSASEIALKELLAYFKSPADTADLFEGYDWTPPIDTSYVDISQSANQLSENLDNSLVRYNQVQGSCAFFQAEKKPLSPVKKTPSELIITKDDPLFLEAIKTFITEFINANLPDEFKKLAPSLIEKLALPLGKNIQIALSVDASDSEKIVAKEVIKLSIRSAAHEVVTNAPDMGPVKKLAAHGAVEVATRNFVNSRALHWLQKKCGAALRPCKPFMN